MFRAMRHILNTFRKCGRLITRHAAYGKRFEPGQEKTNLVVSAEGTREQDIFIHNLLVRTI